MKPILALCLVLALIPASFALAKRGAPKDVPAVKSGTIEYRAPHDHMGYVQAWDTSTGKAIWRRQIYVVKYDPNLESDVQDAFITTLELNDRSLAVKNERGFEYTLHLDSLEVKVVKGSFVVCK